MKTIIAIVAVVLLFGFAASGGPVRREDGTIDAPATLERSADKGGEVAGQGLDDVGNSIGHGVGSTVASSDLAKVGVAGAAAAGVVKYGPRFKPKPVTVPALTPTSKPEKPAKPAKPETTVPTAAPSPTPTWAPMSGGLPATGWSVPPATWKPCTATPGILVSC